MQIHKNNHIYEILKSFTYLIEFEAYRKYN